MQKLNAQTIKLYIQALAEADQEPLADGWTLEEILTDFAQWLEDDVQDEISALDREELQQQEELNLTGFGDIVEDSLTVPQPGFYRCTKTVIMNEGFAEGQFQHQAFAAGKFYEGRPGDNYSIVFIDDTAQKHSASGDWLYEHFEFAAEFNPD